MSEQRPKTGLGRFFGGRDAQTASAPVAAHAVMPISQPSSQLPIKLPLGQRLKKYPCFDFELYVDPEDRIAWPIVHHAVYEHHVVPVFRETVKAGMHVLDVGANIGVYSVAAALGGARVTAIDASPENCKLVTLNAHLNGVQVRALPFAVSDVNGMALFAHHDESNKWVNRNAGLTLESFDAFDAAFAAPIDLIIGNERIDLVKIDIDGREYAALKNAQLLFAQRPIFFMEYARDLTMPGSGVEPLELLKLFTERGYSIRVIGLGSPTVEAGSDIELVDRLAKQAFEKHTHVCIDLMLTP